MTEPSEITPTPKAGVKTTEFWLSTVATIFGILMASGIFTGDSMVGKIVGGAMAVLATMGYSASRAGVKKLL